MKNLILKSISISILSILLLTGCNNEEYKTPNFGEKNPDLEIIETEIDNKSKDLKIEEVELPQQKKELNSIKIEVKKNIVSNPIDEESDSGSKNDTEETSLNTETIEKEEVYIEGYFKFKNTANFLCELGGNKYKFKSDITNIEGEGFSFKGIVTFEWNGYICETSTRYIK